LARPARSRIPAITGAAPVVLASKRPTEAFNGRLKALRCNALGFRNLTHHRWRSLLHSGALHTLVKAL
jgi:transposase